MTDVLSALHGAEYRSIAIRKHQSLFRAGQPARAIYRVERGCLRLQINGEHGHRDIVTFLFPGELSFAGLHRHWASAYAVTEATVAAYSLEAFAAQIGADPEAAMAILLAADRRLRHVAHHLQLLTHGKALQRLKWFLDWLARHSADPVGEAEVHIPMSRSDIADFLGLAPETVSRLFLRLEARGEVRRTAAHRCVLQFDRAVRPVSDYRIQDDADSSAAIAGPPEGYGPAC